MFSEDRKRGFTLIELLVVIAIIGLLASIVLAALSSARTKGTDAQVKEEMSSMRSAAELFNNLTSNTYTGMCSVTSSDTTGVYHLLQSSAYGSGYGAPVCNSVASAYAVQEALSGTSNYWCVDSTGKAKAETVALSTNTVCP